MRFEIIKLDLFSGSCASVYTVIMDGESESLFDQFLQENEKQFPAEIQSIINRIEVIGRETGARENYFKTKEGNPGDGVCALYDEPEKELRLYCIRYGAVAIILGSGGAKKSKKVQKLQDDPKLKKENYLLRKISAMITQAQRDGIIEWSEDGREILGDEDGIIIE